jgi:ubiquinone/menaquinone biosynthesis C-methylase UbiE
MFDNPIKALNAAGIQPGQQVLEVGCGPGFFTVAAAKLVGGNGCVHAIDVHPLAIRTVEEKLRKTGVTNVRVRIADAAETGLPSESIDLVFLFGVVHRLPLSLVLPELHRVLRADGVLAAQTFARRSLERLTTGGFFTFVAKEGGVSKFRRRARNEAGR